MVGRLGALPRSAVGRGVDPVSVDCVARLRAEEVAELQRRFRPLAHQEPDSAHLDERVRVAERTGAVFEVRVYEWERLRVSVSFDVDRHPEA